MAGELKAGDKALTHEDWDKINSISWTFNQRLVIKLFEKMNNEPLRHWEIREESGLTGWQQSMNSVFSRGECPYRLINVPAPDKPLGVYYKIVIIDNPSHRKPVLYPLF